MAYVRETEAPLLPAPANTVGLGHWLREKFYPTPVSGIASLIIGAMALWVLWSMFDWAVLRAVFNAENREPCAAPGAGACWPFVKARFHQWIYGFYPFEERWRINILFVIGAMSVLGLGMPRIPYKGWIALFFLLVYPFLVYFMLTGGSFGLTPVPTDKWGGLVVTLLLAGTGIVLSLPLGILLALGRRSELPIVKTLCIVFIEAVRGVPFITVLFMAANMFPLFMPQGVNPAKILLALIGFTLFSAAYLAEEVRGGLQAIPKGQMEASKALGLSFWKMMSLIIMPQALKIVIPGIVNNFIGLFKDTSLVLVISLFDLLNMVQAGFNDATWASPQTGNTGYFAVAIIYFVFCFAMSRYSQYLEQKLNTGHKR
jgi:general L-amino acid transport system permease protein